MNPAATSGNYQVTMGGASSITVYCDMTTGGGGWTLLLTQTDGISIFACSVVPFSQTVNEDTPSLSAV
jgi:hypothetical protein